MSLPGTETSPRTFSDFIQLPFISAISTCNNTGSSDPLSALNVLQFVQAVIDRNWVVIRVSCCRLPALGLPVLPLEPGKQRLQLLRGAQVAARMIEGTVLHLGTPCVPSGPPQHPDGTVVTSLPRCFLPAGSSGCFCFLTITEGGKTFPASAHCPPGAHPVWGSALLSSGGAGVTPSQPPAALQLVVPSPGLTQTPGSCSPLQQCLWPLPVPLVPSLVPSLVFSY